MKKFDLEAAKKGAAVCLQDGTPVKILDFDFNGDILYKTKVTNEHAGTHECTIVVQQDGKRGEHEEGCDGKNLDLYMAPVYAYAKIYINRYSKELYSGKICATIEEAKIQRDNIFPDMEKFGIARIELL